MRRLCPTLQALLDLGFEKRPDNYGMDTVAYKFDHLDLEASHGTNKYYNQAVFLGGILNTGRTLALIESEIPYDLETTIAAAAWTSYVLWPYKRELAPLPDWMIEGQSQWDLIPHVRDARAYQASPHCVIDRDYARTLRGKLRQELLGRSVDVPVSFAFDGRVLSIKTDQNLFEVVASGSPWPNTYEVTMGPRTKLPTRFISREVAVSFYRGSIRFGNCCYKAREVVM